MGNESDQKRTTSSGTSAGNDDPGPAPGKVNPKWSFDFGELKLAEKELKWIKLGASIKAKGSMEVQERAGDKGVSAPDTVGPSVSSGNLGLKGEHTIAEDHFKQRLLGIELEEKLKQKLTAELSTEQVAVTAGLEGRAFVKDHPEIQGAGDLSFHFAKVKWSDLQRDPKAMNNVKVLAAEGALGLSGETNLVAGDKNYKVSTTVQVVGSASPAWGNIATEVAKKLAERGAQTAATTGTTAGAGATTTAAGSTAAGGATTATGGATATTVTSTASAGSGATAGTAGAGTAGAGTAGATTTSAGAATTTTAGTAAGGTAAGAEGALVIDAAAVAGSAAALIVPLAAAALMIAGGMQMEKNARASAAASRAGVKLRDEINAYVKAYISTIGGGNATGQGALDANAKVLEYMGASGKNRPDACAELVAKNGGRDGLRAAIIGKLRDNAFEQAVALFEAKYKDQFGLVEGIGETWGMRGVFRKDLRGFLWQD